MFQLLKRALPQSLLSFFLGFLWSRRALASVRTRVLSEVIAPAGVSQGSTLLMGGAIVMKKVILATACTALLVGVSILVLQDGGDQAIEIETAVPAATDEDFDSDLGSAEKRTP